MEARELGGELVRGRAEGEREEQRMSEAKQAGEALALFLSFPLSHAHTLSHTHSPSCAVVSPGMYALP